MCSVSHSIQNEAGMIQVKNHTKMNQSTIPFMIVSINNIPFKPVDAQKHLLTKQSTVPLLVQHSSGSAITTIRLKLLRPVKRLHSIVFKNASAAFVMVTLGGGDGQTVYAETQQFSAQQFQAKNQQKTCKLQMHKINNKFQNPNALSQSEIKIQLRSFYDYKQIHALGLHWMEFIAVS